MDPLTWMLLLGGVAWLMGKDAQATAAKDGRTITVAQGVREQVAKVASPAVSKAKEKLREGAQTARQERDYRREAAAQGFAPFGKPTTRKPVFSVKNPSGVEQFLVSHPSLLGRLMSMFGHKPRGPRVYLKGFDSPAPETPGARPASGVRVTPGGGDAGEQPRNARGLTPEQEWITRERIKERLADSAPSPEDTSPTEWVRRIKEQEYERARAEFAPTPEQPPRRVIPGQVVEPDPAPPATETTPTDPPHSEEQERNPMASRPKFTDWKQLSDAQAQAATQHKEYLKSLEAEGRSSSFVEAERRKFAAEWAQHRRDLEHWEHAWHLSQLPNWQERKTVHDRFSLGRLDVFTANPDSFMREWGFVPPEYQKQEQKPTAAAASEQPAQTPPPAADTTATTAASAGGGSAPLRYMEALHAFAASAMTSASIPGLIGSLRQCGEAFTQQGHVLNQVAQRLDEEALLDGRVVELVRAAAESSLRAGSRFTQSAQIAQAYYQRWIDAVSNGARVPSQAVLTATAKS